MTIGKNFIGHVAESVSPRGGVIKFGVGQITTIDDEKIDSVYILVKDADGEIIIEAGLAKETLEALLVTMGEALDFEIQMQEILDRDSDILDNLGDDSG